jgi:transcription elongation factor Elf1
MIGLNGEIIKYFVDAGWARMEIKKGVPESYPMPREEWRKVLLCPDCNGNKIRHKYIKETNQTESWTCTKCDGDGEIILPLLDSDFIDYKDYILI